MRARLWYIIEMPESVSRASRDSTTVAREVEATELLNKHSDVCSDVLSSTGHAKVGLQAPSSSKSSLMLWVERHEIDTNSIVYKNMIASHAELENQNYDGHATDWFYQQPAFSHVRCKENWSKTKAKEHFRLLQDHSSLTAHSRGCKACSSSSRVQLLCIYSSSTSSQLLARRPQKSSSLPVKNSKIDVPEVEPVICRKSKG